MQNMTCGKNTDTKKSNKMAGQNIPINSGIITPLFDGFAYSTSGYCAHCSFFLAPTGLQKLLCNLQISVRIIC